MLLYLGSDNETKSKMARLSTAIAGYLGPMALLLLLCAQTMAVGGVLVPGEGRAGAVLGGFKVPKLFRMEDFKRHYDDQTELMEKLGQARESLTRFLRRPF